MFDNARIVKFMHHKNTEKRSQCSRMSYTLAHLFITKPYISNGKKKRKSNVSCNRICYALCLAIEYDELHQFDHLFYREFEILLKNSI